MSLIVSSPAVCVRCGQPRPDGRTLYCSRRCQKGAQKARRFERDALGLPPQPPSTLRSKPRRRGVWTWTPYGKFEAATGERVQVPETADAQRKAELLVARGCCAYRNRKGFIRDIGVPKRVEHRGKVWSREAGA